MADDVVRLVLAVAAPALLSPLVGCLLADGVGGPPRRRHGRVVSFVAGWAGIVALVLVDLALVRGGTVWACVAAVVAVAACWVGAVFLAVLGHPLVCSVRPSNRSPDVVVVLGTKLGPGGRVPALLAQRLDRAITLWRTAAEGGRTVPLVVTGAAVAGSAVSEAAAMAGYLREHGVPVDCVLREDRATTTDENLLLSSDLIAARLGTPPAGRRAAAREVAVVTNTFHTFRTARTAARLHVPARVRAAPTPWTLLPAAALRELGVLLGERLPVRGAGCALLAAAALLVIALGR